MRRNNSLNELVKNVFNQIKFECRPNKDKPFFDEVLSIFFGGTEQNFIGGMNDDRNTLHENLFHAMFPDLKAQVHFGTGVGGYEKYLSKRYTADFYDEERNIIFEIDGRSHNTEINIMKDKIRDYFFFHELGIRTIRYTNDEVEEMLTRRLKRLDETGELSEFFKQ